jgi:hypothetical protein
MSQGYVKNHRKQINIDLYECGDTLFSQGDEGPEPIFVVLYGAVNVYESKNNYKVKIDKRPLVVPKNDEGKENYDFTHLQDQFIDIL